MRPIDAHELWTSIQMLPHNGDMISSEEVEQCVAEAPSVNILSIRDYRVPSTEEWMERYCTKKQLAGYEKRKEATNGTD